MRGELLDLNVIEPDITTPYPKRLLGMLILFVGSDVFDNSP